MPRVGGDRDDRKEGFDLLPGNIDLTAAEIQLMDMPSRESRLKQALAPCATTTTSSSSTARRRCRC